MREECLKEPDAFVEQLQRLGFSTSTYSVHLKEFRDRKLLKAGDLSKFSRAIGAHRLGKCLGVHGLGLRHHGRYLIH